MKKTLYKTKVLEPVEVVNINHQWTWDILFPKIWDFSEVSFLSLLKWKIKEQETFSQKLNKDDHTEMHVKWSHVKCT